MDLTTNLFIVGFIIIVGLLAQFLFRKIKIPDVLILISFGAILASFGLTQEITTGSDALTFLITFSLIYVVFYGALPIRLEAIFSTLKYASISSALNFIFITGALGLLSYGLGYDWVLAFSLGALFCVLDGSIINSILEILKLGPKAEAQIQTESAIIDTLVIVGILSILNFSAMGFSDVLRNLSSYLFLSFGIGFVAAIVWSFFNKQIMHYSSAPVATMALLVMMYAFAEFVNANGVITVFSFAIIFGNIPLLSKLFYKEQSTNISPISFATKTFFKEISFLIRSFLFVYLGMLIDFYYWQYLLVGMFFFLIAYVIRSLINNYLHNSSLNDKGRYFLQAMCAKGLTPTVMIAVIQSDAIFTNIVVGGIFSSILITSVLIFLIQKGKFTSVNDIFFKKKVKPAKKLPKESREMPAANAPENSATAAPGQKTN